LGLMDIQWIREIDPLILHWGMNKWFLCFGIGSRMQENRIY
jgi:hypothetical protein